MFLSNTKQNGDKPVKGILYNVMGRDRNQLTPENPAYLLNTSWNMQKKKDL